MPEGINPKPWVQIAFTLAAGARQQFETANAAVLYVAEGPGISPGALSIQLDENEAFRVARGDFVRVERFDKLRVVNNLGVSISGLIFVSNYRDMLYMNFDRGI